MLTQWNGWVRWAVRQKGVAGALRMGLRRIRRGKDAPLSAHPFDREHGVDTSGWIQGGALSAGHRNAQFATAYAGVAPSRMRAILDQWQSTPGTQSIASYTFIDVGCGKGRSLMIASEKTFREAIGIELDPALAEIAAHNLSIWKRAQAPVRVVCGDATEVELPDGPILLYLYNPFHAQVLRRLLARLAERQTVVEILYLYPKDEAVFEEFPQFKLLWKNGLRLAPEEIGVDLLEDIEDFCSAWRLER